MPSVGDTKTIFGRTYVYSNPNQALGPGTWLLSDGEGSVSANQQTEHTVYGTAIVADTSIPIKRGMLVRIDDDGKAVAAIATSIENARVVGVAIDPANTGQVVQFTQNTVFEFFNASAITDEASASLDVGKPYYLSADNEGKWTKDPNRLDVNNQILQCGVAVGEFYMAIDIQPVEQKQNQETAILEAGITAVSDRIDVLEQDPTTATALSLESAARAASDIQQVNRLDALEASDTSITSRLDTLESTDGTTTTRIEALESADVLTTGRLDALEATDTQTTDRIDALESDTSAQTLSAAALADAKAYTDQEIASIPAVSFDIDYGEYA